MADLSKIKLNDTVYNLKDAQARQDLNGKQATITASGILKGDGSGGITAATAGTDYPAIIIRDWAVSE